jgi:hypothetical protein
MFELSLRLRDAAGRGARRPKELLQPDTSAAK